MLYDDLLVGKNTGKLENATLQLKYINPRIHPLRSSRPAKNSLKLIFPMRGASPACLTPLALATSLSSSFKNRAFSGLSGKKKNATTAITMVGRPSTRNSTLHLASDGLPLVIAYASAPANVFASGAALRKSPLLKPSSSRR